MLGFLKKIRRSAALMLLLLSLFGISADAAVFYSYSYNAEGETAPSPEGALPSGTFYGSEFAIGNFSSPSDIFISGDRIYIADTKNNRIVVTDPEFRSAEAIDSFERAGKLETFLEPSGICVANDALYIADTGNSRIVKLSLEGEFLLEITAPEDESLPEDFTFKPVKIAADSYGRIFVISDGYNMGLMQFDENNVYLKSVGAPKVNLSIAEQIWRKFSTKEQQERTQSVVPTEYSNLCIDGEGFIYVTNESTSKDIKAVRKLNANGTDVLNDENEFFGDNTSGGITYTGASAIVDLCEMEGGNYAILDRKRSRVFVYNNESEMLYAFSGPGTYGGSMSVAAAMAYSDGRFYICDTGKNAVCVFTLSDYGRLFSEIAEAKADIDFERESELWNEVIERNVNCTLAMCGLGDAAYKNRDMSLAMNYYKRAGAREEYSNAYSYVRREWIESNVVVILSGAVILCAGTAVLLRLYRKRLAAADKNSLLRKINFSSYVCFHPLDGFWDLKREKRGSVKMAAFWFAAAAAVFVSKSLFTGFIFNYTDIDSYNMLGNIVFVAAAVMIWCIAQWSVTSLMNGEGKFADIFVATCYALRPYVVINIIAVLLSNVLLIDEGDFYFILAAFALIWSAALIILGLMQTHNYTLSKTFLVIIVIAVVILLIVFIGMLAFALCQQLVAFIKDLVNEVTLRV